MAERSEMHARHSRQGRNPAFLRALVAVAALWFGCSAALAQSAACPQLNAMLQSLDANPTYRDAGQSAENLTALQADERNAEQAYVRTGCQAAQDARQPQTPQCRGIARQILSERAQIAQLQQSAGTGSALAGQRQQIMRQMARYGCVPATSGANFSGTSEPPHRSLLEQLFGGPSQDDYGDDTGQPLFDDTGETPPEQQGTIRTMCVRLSDGYYWPISYSTTQDYIPQDTATCESECPGQQVRLYFYANPGQDPTQMVDAMGDRYAALPSAFAYRKQFDLKNSCGAEAALGDGTAATGNAVASPPVPPMAASAMTDIPLPRPRPGDPDAPPDAAAATPVAAPAPPPATRVVRVGNKLVRLVGPETPYAPQTADPG